MRARRIECVVLNACYSHPQAEAIAIYVGHVIGVKQTIDNRMATEFAVGFYDALGAGEAPDRAYHVGRTAMQLIGCADSELPVLERGQLGGETCKEAWKQQRGDARYEKICPAWPEPR